MQHGRAYDYGVERLAAHTGGSWNAQKTEYVYDGRGSVAQEIGYNNSWYTFKGALSKKNVVSKSYSPFGELLNRDNINNMTNYAFNGEAYDPATGMVNLRARQYESGQMRFGQRDRLSGYNTIPSSLNRYLYCENDPVNFADLDGLKKESLWSRIKTGVSTVINKFVSNPTVQKVAQRIAATPLVQKIAASKPVQNFIQNHPSIAQGAAKLGNALGINNSNSKSANNTTNKVLSTNNGYASTDMLRQQEQQTTNSQKNPSDRASSNAVPIRYAPTDDLHKNLNDQVDFKITAKTILDELDSAGIDTSNLNKKQKEIVEAATLELTNSLQNGTLTNDAYNRIVREACRKVEEKGAGLNLIGKKYGDLETQGEINYTGNSIASFKTIPYYFTANKDGAISIRINSISKGDFDFSNATITVYRLDGTKIGNSREIDVGGDESISGLNPNASYYFKVTAKSKVSTGELFKSFEFDVTIG